MPNSKYVLWIFLLLNTLICFFYLDVYENPNTVSRVLPIVSFAENGTFQIDKYHDKTIDISFVKGHYYMDKAPLPSMFVLPFFILFKSCGIIQMHNGSFYGKSVFLLADILCGCLPFFIILCLIYWHLHSKCKLHSLLPAILCFYGSFVFIFSGTFFAHVFSGCLLLIAYINLGNRKYFWCGMFSGLAFLSEFTLIWVIIIWGVQLIFSRKVKFSVNFILGFLPSAIFILTYNYYFTGSPFSMLYLFVSDNFDVVHKSTYGLTYPKPDAIWGLLFSSGRGIIYYSPAIVYISILYIKNITTNISASNFMSTILQSKIVLPFVFTLLFISSHAAWEGGYSYGPRHLIGVTILIMFAGIKSDFFAKKNWLLNVLLAFGTFCALLAKGTFQYSMPVIDENILTYLLFQIKSSNFNSGNVLSLCFDTSPYVSFSFFIILFCLTLISSFFMFKSKSHSK